MQRKVLRLTPDDFGYEDRGKMKWLGLILSDHTESLKQMKEQEKKLNPPAKEQMSETAISKMLREAYVRKLPILLQANIVKNGMYYPDLACLVLGFQEDHIYFKLKDGRTCHCEMYQIRNIEWMNPAEWYEKN